MKSLILYSILSIMTSQSSCMDEGEENFNRDHFGVVFSPYVKNRVNGSIPPWNTYTLKDVKTMLDLTSTKFKHISTYGMGVGNPNGAWREGDAVALTAIGSAELNKERRNPNRTLSVALGIWHNDNADLYEREILNSIEAGKDANRIYPETVWGVALSSLGWMAYSTGPVVLEYLNKNREAAHEAGLKIGVRLDTCDQIIPTQRPEDENKLHSARLGVTSPPPLSNIQKIARATDFLICNTFPTSSMVSQGVKSTVNALSTQMNQTLHLLRAENPLIIVSFESGWPSAGVSRTGSKNTGRNMRTFWKLLADAAVVKNLNIYMLEAFDEPWKASSDKGDTDPSGPNGAESHFGWWSLKDNDDLSSFEEKVIEPEETEFPVWLAVLIVVLILLPIIGLLVWRLHRAGQLIERLTEQDIKEFQEGIPRKGKGDGSSVENALHLPYDRSFELSKDAFVIDELEILGSGAFGTVYKGRINGIDGHVAFKKPNKDISVSQLKNLLSEIKIMIYIGKHENVVVLLGAHTDQIRDGIVYIASECCALGSLESHLRNIPRTFTSLEYANTTDIQPGKDDLEVRYVNHVKKPIENTTKVPVSSLYRWSFEVAKGMEYLASKKVIHADLATRNVLLTADGTAKISDFGLSRRLYEYTQYVKASQEPLPWRWMAIESLRNLSFSTLSDVWSYGITIWEIFSLGDLPYPGLSWDVKFVDELERGLRMQMPKYATKPIYDQMIACWHLDPECRPTFTTLKEFFETLSIEEGKLGTMV